MNLGKMIVMTRITKMKKIQKIGGVGIQASKSYTSHIRWKSAAISPLTTFPTSSSSIKSSSTKSSSTSPKSTKSSTSPLRTLNTMSSKYRLKIHFSYTKNTCRLLVRDGMNIVFSKKTTIKKKKRMVKTRLAQACLDTPSFQEYMMTVVMRRRSYIDWGKVWLEGRMGYSCVDESLEVLEGEVIAVDTEGHKRGGGAMLGQFADDKSVVFCDLDSSEVRRRVRTFLRDKIIIVCDAEAEMRALGLKTHDRVVDIQGVVGKTEGRKIGLKKLIGRRVGAEFRSMPGWFFASNEDWRLANVDSKRRTYAATDAAATFWLGFHILGLDETNRFSEDGGNVEEPINVDAVTCRLVEECQDHIVKMTIE